MRSVSSATWTRVLPVSVSVAPKRVTISRVFSGDRVLMRRPRVAAARAARASLRPRRRDRARLLDVAAHLLDERRRRSSKRRSPRSRLRNSIRSGWP